MIVPLIFFIFICIYAVKGGIEPICRFSELFVVVLILIIVISGFLTIPYMKLIRIKPILGDGIYPVLQGAFSAFAFPLGETVVFTMLFSSLKKGDSPYKVYLLGILIGVFVVSGFVKISLCLLASCKGIARIFNVKDYRFMVTPVGILMTLFSIIVYKNIMEMSEWAFSIWTIYAIPFQVVLPLIVHIGAEIKCKNKKTIKTYN